MKPAAGYSFSSMQEIKSHSSALFNERMAILFYLLDMKFIELHQDMQNRDMMFTVFSLLRQIYKNVRTLIRNNPTMRATLNIETNDEGIYLTDVMDSNIERLLMYCETYGYTMRKCYIIVREMDDFEVQVKDILQYYHYFVRPDFRQKPDVLVATEKYRSMVDGMTIDQLKEVVGKQHKIDFEGLTMADSEEKIMQLMNVANQERVESDEVDGFDDLDDKDVDFDDDEVVEEE
jgi:hypothetical protein